MQVLQIGRDDWSAGCTLPKGVDWVFADIDDPTAFDAALIGRTDVTVLDAVCPLERLQAVDALVNPYTLVVARQLDSEFDDDYRDFFRRKGAVFADVTERQPFVDDLPRRYFPKPFGQKLAIRTAVVSPFHRADAWFEGNAYLVTDVEEPGDEFRQLVMWKENVAYDSGRPLELWPEFVVEPGCEIEFHLQLIKSGTPDVIAFQKTYSQQELGEPIVLAEPTSGYLSCSVFARGTGRVKIGPIHYRHSRLGAGQFLPGGRRLVDARREELFFYFHPGDLQPPLNIYFAGYRPAEGFEGYFMMERLGHPFVLVSDPRLEGGRFYLGRAELEGALVGAIRAQIDELGFTERDVIFSGLSMGSFGALYYGSQFDAHAIIAGKPIIDLSHVAERGPLVRPHEFFTIFDMVNFWQESGHEGEASTAGEFTRELVDRWRGEPGFGDTKILLAYMEQDDYDDEAYVTLLGSQAGKTTTVIARGYQGRHNDDSPSIVAWFSSQYRRVIDEYRRVR